MKNHYEMMKTLPKTEIGLDVIFGDDYDKLSDTFHYRTPHIDIYDYEGQSVLGLSTESGNMESFVYSNERIVDIKDELKVWAKKFGKEWVCRYEGTYVLLDI